MEKRFDPWSSNIQNYESAFDEFGLSKFNDNLKLNHYFFERNIIIAHRDFDKVYKKIKEKKPFVQMTGIATSGKLHLGHKIDIDLFVFFSKFKNSKNYFALSDIDAYCSREKIKSMEEAKKYAVNNLAHILALGVPLKAIYAQSKKEPRYYEFIFEISKKITKNMFEAVYGHLDLGKIEASLLQYADILHPQLKEYEGKMPSLTGIGLDQDSHARMTRDLARKFNLELSSFIYFLHQSGLRQGSKMSSSMPETAIYLDDSQQEIKKKIQHAFTGGLTSAEEQRKKGGNPDICKVHEILKFHNPDTKFVKEIYERCRKGNILCGECKQICSDFVSDMLKKHQEKVKKFIPIANKFY
ncbi:MAG: tryptophan--tRNA ligase [Nanoarchaeota archaeon]|nr:tryptophan--tRNA ligase [Nanoarchaeota archaeon]